jgi:hypothetical protein
MADTGIRHLTRSTGPRHQASKQNGRTGSSSEKVTCSPSSVFVDVANSNSGADLRDVQIAARHADPRTTMRYD